jgi:Ser/Thr protein kinase RdoA (MazF antagonist)
MAVRFAGMDEGKSSQAMINKIDTPFAGLSPDRVLDAASSVGLDPDGRLFALNSYENRVYQLGSAEGTLILKFYRPARWDDAQILEEHSFTAEMAAAELPVAAPVAISGKTLFRHGEFRFAAFPFLRGGAPELDAPEAREILGRSIARLHQVGARRPFERRPEIGIERLGVTARAMVLQADLLPEGLRDR